MVPGNVPAAGRSVKVDATLALIDGALQDDLSGDAMRWTDDALVISGNWPPDYFVPRDHDGCQCAVLDEAGNVTD